jgi:hypothetical protein
MKTIKILNYKDRDRAKLLRCDSRGTAFKEWRFAPTSPGNRGKRSWDRRKP